MENSNEGLIPFSRQNVVLPRPSKDALGSIVEYGLKDYKSQRSGRAGVKCRLDKTRPLYSKAHSCWGRPHKVSMEEETHMLLP